MGEVFAGDGTVVHEGLVVCDGAFVPAALGVNPFATITALAERSVELVAQKKGIEIDFETKNGESIEYGFGFILSVNRHLRSIRQTSIPCLGRSRPRDHWETHCQG
jgi:hypothetical protein